MALPPCPRVNIRDIIRPGSVYYFHDDELSSPEPHYFVVLNKNPDTDSVLVLVCSSSQVRATLLTCGMMPETLVQISPAEYRDFSRDSIVNCNSVFERNIAKLQQKNNNGALWVKSIMPPAILQKLRDAVEESCVVDEDLKDFII